MTKPVKPSDYRFSKGKESGRHKPAAGGKGRLPLAQYKARQAALLADLIKKL